jgi:hypothetical protein
MDHRITSSFGFIGSVAAAALAAAVMSGNARAEGPIEHIYPTTGQLTRAEVQAQVDRGQLSSYASEYALQQDTRLQGLSGYTREQARADYIASRDEVHAMNAEDSGSQRVSRAPASTSMAVVAVSPVR